MKSLLLSWIVPMAFVFGLDNVKNDPMLYGGGTLPVVTVCDSRIPTTQDSIKHLAMTTTKYFESVRLKAYHDYKQYSIGWGTRANHPSEIIDIDEANRRFEEHFYMVLDQVSEEFPNLSPSQKYATTIFAYNVSIHQIIAANVTPRKLRNGEKPPFHLWVHAGGEVLDGLVTRRQLESEIWDDWRSIYNEELPRMESIIHNKSKRNA